MNKIYGLNYIRAIGAVLVMLYHYTTRYLESFMEIEAEKNHIGIWWGCFAVSAFFILSGFLTVANIKDNLSPKKFIYKRVSRLYPAYWTAIICTTLATYIFNSKGKLDLFSTIVNFSMFQGFLGISNVDGAYWTLMYELWFYAIIAVTLFLRKRDYNIISSVWLSIVIIQRFILTSVFEENLIVKLIGILFITQWAHVFIMGVSLNGILKKQKSMLPYLNLIICLYIEYETMSIERFCFVVCVILLCLIFVLTKFRMKKDAVLNFFAEISFPLYLLHQNIGYIIIGEFENRFMGTCTAIIISVCLAYTVHRYIEEPIGVYLNKKLKLS